EEPPDRGSSRPRGGMRRQPRRLSEAGALSGDVENVLDREREPVERARSRWVGFACILLAQRAELAHRLGCPHHLAVVELDGASPSGGHESAPLSDIAPPTPGWGAWPHPASCGAWTRIGVARPGSSTSSPPSKPIVPSTSRRVASETRIAGRPVLVRRSIRAATFTVSPIAVNSRRLAAPTSPTTTGPECTPMPIRSAGSPRATRVALRACRLRCIASAHRTARVAWSAWSTGAPKYAISPSPRYLSSV